MNIAYVATARIPTEKAHGWQIMRVCSALAERGHEVTLHVPKRGNVIREDAFAYYGLKPSFQIVHVPCIDVVGALPFLGPLAFWITEWSFRAALRIPRESVVYTRDQRILAMLAARGYACFYSAHNWKTSRMGSIVRARGAICNSKGTQQALQEAVTIPTLVVPNGTDPNPYREETKAVLRAQLGLPEGPLALYAGHLYGWKGAAVLFEAARQAPEVQFVVIGGEAPSVKLAKESASPNMHVLGHKKKEEVPMYLAAADVLLLPNSAQSEESVRYTSPLKLFEYMASGTPMIASDLPSIREVLDEHSAYFVSPDDPQAIAACIRSVFDAPEIAQRHAAGALEAVKRYSWDAHAEAIEEFFKQHI